MAVPHGWVSRMGGCHACRIFDGVAQVSGKQVIPQLFNKTAETPCDSHGPPNACNAPRDRGLGIGTPGVSHGMDNMLVQPGNGLFP